VRAYRVVSKLGRAGQASCGSSNKERRLYRALLGSIPTGPFSPFILPMIMVVNMITSLPFLLTFLQWFRANGILNGL
jgi:hypothetical protein